MRKIKSYEIYESLRCALPLTFISGYLNAFTFITQNRRFAGVQTGNLLSFGLYLAEGSISKALHFLLPIIAFMLGQSLVYLAHVWTRKKHLPWHLLASLSLTIIILLVSILMHILSQTWILVLLVLFAAIQVDVFKSLRGTTYANLMMTGNVKNAAYLLTKGLVEKNCDLLYRGRNILMVLLAFLCGVILSTLLLPKLGEMTLTVILIPLFYINMILYQEYRFNKTPRLRKAV